MSEQLIQNEDNCVSSENINVTVGDGNCTGVYLEFLSVVDNCTDCIGEIGNDACVALEGGFCELPSTMPSVSLTPSHSFSPSVTQVPSESLLPSATRPSSLPSFVPTRTPLTTLCSDGVTIGYQDYASLASDALDGNVNFASTTLTLCPDTVFRGDLVVTGVQGAFTVQCVGCVWEGFVLLGTSNTMVFDGLTFRGATDVSVTIVYNPTTDMQFVNCTWQVCRQQQDVPV